jgi:hypothetical protein
MAAVSEDDVKEGVSAILDHYPAIPFTGSHIARHGSPRL